MNNKLPYSHLMYVREYSIDDDSYNMVIYGVNTEDIFHTMSKLMYRNPTQVKRITYAECTQRNFNYWLKNGFKIRNFKDKDTDVKM